MGSNVVELDFRVQAKKATAELKNINNSVKTLGSRISTTRLAFSNMLGGLATSAITSSLSALSDAVVSSFTTIVSEGAKLETVTTEFETLIGSMEVAQKLIKDIGKAAASTPFEIEGLEQASKQLLAFGYNTEDIVPLLLKLGDASAVGAGDIVGLTRVFTKVNGLGRVLAEQYETLINQSPVLAQALVKAAGVSGVGALRRSMDQGKVSSEVLIKALDMVTSKGGKAFEGMAKKASTFDGRLSNLKDSITLMARRIGSALIPALSKLVHALTKAIERNKEFIITFAKSKVIEPMIKGLKQLVIFLNKLDASILTSIIRSFAEIVEHTKVWVRILGATAGIVILTRTLQLMQVLKSLGLDIIKLTGKGVRYITKGLLKLGKTLLSLGRAFLRFGELAVSALARIASVLASFPAVTAALVMVWSSALDGNSDAILENQKRLDSYSTNNYVLELSKAAKANQDMAESFWDSTPLMVATMGPAPAPVKETGLSKAELARIKADENAKSKLYAETAALRMTGDINAATLRAYLREQTKTQELGLNQWYLANSSEKLRIISENIAEESRVRLEGIALQKEAEKAAIDDLTQKMKDAEDHLKESFEIKLEARIKNLKKLEGIELKAQMDLDKKKLALFLKFNQKAEQDRKSAAKRVVDIETEKDQLIRSSAFSSLQMIGGAIAKGADTRIAISSAIGAAEAVVNGLVGQTLANATIPQPGGAIVGAAVLNKAMINAGLIAAKGLVQMGTNQGFAEGGHVGGTSYVGDMVPIRVNSGEAVLNATQQKNFMDIANGKTNNINSNNNFSSEDMLALANRPIIVEIDGHAIASTVRDQVNDGFDLGVN